MPGPPTAAILPSMISTVPPSMGSPSTGTTYPPVIAMLRPLRSSVNATAPSVNGFLLRIRSYHSTRVIRLTARR